MLAVLFGLLVGYPTVMVIGTVIAGAGMVVLVVQDGCSIPLQVGLRFGWVAGLQLAIQVGVAIEAVLLALAGAGLLPFFALQLPVVVPALVVTVVVGGRDARLIPSIDLREWRRMVRRILPLLRRGRALGHLLPDRSDHGVGAVELQRRPGTSACPSACWPRSPRCRRCSSPPRSRCSPARRATTRSGSTTRAAGSPRRCCSPAAAWRSACSSARGSRSGVIAGPGFGPSVEVLRILAFALLGTFVIGARGYALLSLDRLRAMLVVNAIALTVVLGPGCR